jgi:hypothetical protein
MRKLVARILINFGHHHNKSASEFWSVLSDGVVQVWVCARPFNRHNVPQRVTFVNVFLCGVDSDPVRVGNAYITLALLVKVAEQANIPGRS